jgi:hypothetical protein
MPLPVKFDQNEWFIIVSIIIAYSITFFLPRRFPSGITVLIMLFGPTVARLFDHFLASPKLDLYTLTDTTKYDLFDLITYFLYAPFSYFFVYIYDRLKVKGYWTILYILLCTSFGTIYEWISTLFHVFKYNGWKLNYSFTVYLLTQCFALLFYHLVKRNYYLLSKEKGL